MDEVQEKQKYLCDNILDQGYDAEDFAEFCERLMGNMDIASWTFQQLSQIVSKYVDSKQTTTHADHQASFIDYQQESEVPQRQPEPSPIFVPEIREPPIFNMSKKKESPIREPSPYRQEYQEPKKQLKPQINVEQLFKDPFAKIKEKPSIRNSNSDWGTGSWGTTLKPTTATVNKEFNFMDLLAPTSTTVSPAKTSTTANHLSSLANSPPILPPNNDYQLRQPIAKPPQPITKPQPKPIEPFQPIKIDSNKQSLTDIFNNFGSPTSTSDANGVKPVPAPIPVALGRSYVGLAPKKPVGNINIFEMTIDDIPQPSQHKNNHSEPVITNLSGLLSPPQRKLEDSNVRSTSQTMSVADMHGSAVQNTERSKSQQSKPKVPYQGQKVVQEEFYDVIPCAKAHSRTLFNTPNVQIVITGHQIVNRNFFVPDYVLYHLHTKGINVDVKRKYNHFVRLRNMLCKFYPGFRVPYLEKNPWLSETDPQFIKKQKVMIEFFINDVIMNKEFRNCRIVEEFLTLEYKKLKAKLQEYDKLARLKSLEELCLLTGEVNIAYTDQHRIYCENITPFLTQMGHQMDKYRRLQDQLTHNYTNLLKTYSQIYDTLVVMETTCKSFNSQVNFCEFYEMEQTIKSLNDIYRQMASSVRFDVKVLQAEFKPIFRFEKENMLTIREQLETRNKMTEAYSKGPQPAQKEPYVNNSKLAGFKIAAEQPSKHPTVLKYQNGYYNAQVVIQNMRMFKDLSTKLNFKFAHIAAQYQERKAQETGFWTRKKASGLAM